MVSFTFQTSLTIFLSSNTKTDSIKSFMEKSSLNILPNFSFCVSQQKVSHEGKKIFIWGMICFFNNYRTVSHRI